MMKLFLLYIVWIGSTTFAMAENWSGFRGPEGQGISNETSLPLVWNDSTGIAWRTDVPGSGWSSPIVWDDHVFLTTTVDSGKSCHVLAFNLDSGDLIWNSKVFDQLPGHLHIKNSHASPTPVTDGKMIFAVFGDASIVALDFAGKQVWQNREFQYYSEHGLGASPIIYNDLIIMTYDGSSPGPDKKVGWTKPWEKAIIVAYDKKNGKVRWKAKRGLSRIAHVTPAIMTVGDKSQLISAAGDVVQGFDPESGDLLWTVESPGEGVVPSVVLGDGLLFTASGWGDPAIRAIRPGTKNNGEIIWEYKKDVPKIPSFVYKNPYLYTISENGIAMCLDGNTGQILWRERIAGKYSASPLIAEQKIYFTNEKAQTTVVKTVPEFQVIAKNNLTGKCQASMAAAEGRILIRTDTQLFCVKNK